MIEGHGCAWAPPHTGRRQQGRKGGGKNSRIMISRMMTLFEKRKGKGEKEEEGGGGGGESEN